MTQSKFKPGDDVVNVDDASVDLTLGKTYKVTAVFGDHIHFRDDVNDMRERRAQSYRLAKTEAPPIDPTSLKFGDLLKLRSNPSRGMSAKPGALARFSYHDGTFVRVVWDHANGLAGAQRDGGYSPSDFELVTPEPIDASTLRAGDKITVELTVALGEVYGGGRILAGVPGVDPTAHAIYPGSIVKVERAPRPLAAGEKVMFANDTDRTIWEVVGPQRPSPSHKGKERVAIFNADHGYSTTFADKLQRAA